MKTIFLASGQSSRMSPLSDKTLLSFCGKPLLIHLLQKAEKSGLKNFIIVANNSNQEEIKKILQEYHFKAEITLQEDLSEGMAGGIKDGLKKVKDEEPVVILGGNDYVENQAYTDILEALEKNDGVILGKNIESYFPGGYLLVDENNRIKSIIEKPGEGNEPSNKINIVLHGFKKAGDLKKSIALIKSSTDDVYEKALDLLLKEKNISCVDYSGIWQAIKYPWHVLEMQEILLKEELKGEDQKIHPSLEIKDTARIRGKNIFIEEGVKIQDNAVIQGPCYIGKNTIIGNNVLLRNAHIGNNCTIGYNTEIARSYLAEKVSTHISYIGDSIVDKNVNFGAFSTTANLRLDQNPIKVNIKNERISTKRIKFGSIVGAFAQIGIHSLLMPGSKVEAHEFILPGEIKK